MRTKNSMIQKGRPKTRILSVNGDKKSSDTLSRSLSECDKLVDHESFTTHDELITRYTQLDNPPSIIIIAHNIGQGMRGPSLASILREELKFRGLLVGLTREAYDSWREFQDDDDFLLVSRDKDPKMKKMMLKLSSIIGFTQ